MVNGMAPKVSHSFACFSPANHHSIIAKYSYIATRWVVYDSTKQAAH
jgi:hypothetical protein